MELHSYVTRIHQEVANAVALAGPEAQAGADRLLTALDPALRLVILEALTDAAAEITTALPSGNVDARLRGRDLTFVVEGVGSTDSEAAASVRPGDAAFDDLGEQVRLTLRLSEGLKTRAEELSNELGQSLNSWLVDTVRGATSGSGIGDAWPAPPKAPRPPKSPGRKQSGWA